MLNQSVNADGKCLPWGHPDCIRGWFHWIAVKKSNQETVNTAAMGKKVTAFLH